MKCCFIFAVLFTFQNFDVKGKFDISRLVNTVGRMKDKNVRIENVDNYMQCINKCYLRTKCMFVLFELFTEDVFTKTDYKCSLCKKAANLTQVHKKPGRCPNRDDLIFTFPKVIAGACSDHKCADGKKCHPREGGGYTCDRERGRKNKRK